MILYDFDFRLKITHYLIFIFNNLATNKNQTANDEGFNSCDHISIREKSQDIGHIALRKRVG